MELELPELAERDMEDFFGVLIQAQIKLRDMEDFLIWDGDLGGRYTPRWGI